MAGAHCVHIQFLHYADVVDHVLLGDDIALVGVHLVAIRALDEDRLAVDKQLAVLDLDSSESEVDGRAFHNVLPVGGRHFQSVEVRDLSAPEIRILNHSIQDGLPFYRSRLPVSHLVAVPVDDGDTDVPHALGDLRVDSEVPVHPGDDVHILDALPLAGIDIDPAGYSAEPPEVLVLKIRAVAPAEDLKGDEVLACLDVLGQVEAGLQLAVLAVADHLSVDPDTDVGGGGADAEADLFPDPRLVNVEHAAILTDVVVLSRRVRRIVLVVPPPGEADVKVDRVVVPVQLPHSRDRDRAPVRVVVVHGLEAFCAALDGLVPFELPDSVQSQGLLLVGDKGGGHRQAVLLEHVRILPRFHLVVLARKKRGRG